jgi:RNA 2',3'-cyclic 3'-phosphodiesterase
LDFGFFLRLFTAIELGDDVCANAGTLVDTLRRRASHSAPDARVTWVAPERMHLTLRFIGEVDDSKAEAIVSALREPIAHESFDVRWRGLGSFPPRGAPRVLWVGVAIGSEELRDAERAISDRLATLGMPRENRPYSPHLTLARVREPAGLRTAPLFEGLDGALGETHVNAITLFRSHLSPKGPTYVVMQKTPFSRN